MAQEYIILVDDDYISNHITQKVINKAYPPINYQVFKKAQDALEHIKNNNLPRLILLDINMPEMDGWQFIEHLIGLNINIPICFLTSSINPKDVSRAKNIKSVKAYISKPLNPEKLEQIEDLLGTSNIEQEEFVLLT